MAARIHIPPPFDAHSFTVGTALEAGIGRSRLQGHDLARPFWGIRVPSASAEAAMLRVAPKPDEHESVAAQHRARALARAYFARMKPGQFFSHLTAARLHGIPLPTAFDGDDTLDVSVPYPARAVRAIGIGGHKQMVLPRDVVMVKGLPVSSPARVWLELGSLMSTEDLIGAGDYLLWWRQPKVTRAELARAVDGYIGRSGKARLVESLPLLSNRSDSPPESKFRYRFGCAGLPAPEVNEKMYDDQGRFLAMPDLAFKKYRMAIDYEGDHHRTDRHQWQKDLGRVPRLEDADWHSTRASAADLRDSRELIDRLRRLLRARGWTG